MRPSQRTAILDAALDLVGSEDGADITLDAVARVAGVTKPGLMYHFPTKEDLMLAIVDHQAGRWESRLLDALGRPFDEASSAERTLAYVEVASSGQLARADFAIFAQAGYRPAYNRVWAARLGRWFDLPADLPADERARLTTARLAADGLWAADATGLFRPAATDRQAVVDLIHAVLDGGAT